MSAAYPQVIVRNTIGDDIPGIIQLTRLVYPDSPPGHPSNSSRTWLCFPKGSSWSWIASPVALTAWPPG